MTKPDPKPAVAASDSDRIGFFGKVPSHGDFISEGLDREFITRLDEWLRAGMHACADQYGARWSSVFSNAPPTRFISEIGVWGDAAYVGVLLPSRDRVGRRYPLVVLAQLTRFRLHPRTLYLDETWFMAAEALAETSMSEDFDMNRFTTAIKRLRLPKPKEDDDAPVPTHNRDKPTSLWWQIDAETRRPKGVKLDGRPGTADFIKLFQDNKLPPEPAPRSEKPQQVGAAKSPTLAPKAPVALPLAAKPVTSTSIIYSYATHAGTKLSANADSLFVSSQPPLFAIADGIGENHAAAEAARLTVNLLADVTAGSEHSVDPQTIRGKLGTVNSLLLSRQVGEGALRPGASVVAASIFDQTITVLWSGDARAYLLRDGTMHPLTRDHVIVGMKRTLAQYIGHSQQFRPDIIRENWGWSDRLLLCSFPLVQQLKERVVAELLSETKIEDCAEALIQEALIETARDNISAIVIGHDRVPR